MQNKVEGQIQDIIVFYEHLVGSAETMYQQLVAKDSTELHSLNKKMMMMTMELQRKLEDMQQEVARQCAKNGAAGTTLTALLPYLESDVQERMTACRETAFHFEEKLKNITMKINCQATAVMESNQVLLDASVKVAREEEKGNNLFLDREF